MKEDLFPEDRKLFNDKYQELRQGFTFAPSDGSQFGSICSGQMKWHDHRIVRKAIAARAGLFSSLCLTFVEKYGKDAEELIKQTQWDSGMAQCKKWADFAGIEIGTVTMQELPAILCSGAEIYSLGHHLAW